MENQEIHLGEYLAVLKRRKFSLILPILVILAGSIGLAFGLPSIYESTATILIEQQEIPEELVSTTVTGYAAERIQILSQRILTTENLRNVIVKHDLFKNERALGNEYAVIEEMRRNITVKMVSAEVGDPRGRTRQATIAFSIAYEDASPEATKKVTEDLVSFYLQGNQRLRAEKAEVTSDFLAEETNKLSQKISVLEQQLASYKERNQGKLPEMMNLNMSMMERTEKELEEVERRIGTLNERKVLVEDQVIQTNPYTGESPSARLRDLQTAYLRGAAQYSLEHPDMIKMRREIQILTRELGAVDNTDQVIQELNVARTDLAKARRDYGEDHPKVTSLQRTVSSLEDNLYRIANEMNKSSAIEKPDNPQYLALQGQLKTLEISLKSELELKVRLKEKLRQYEERVEQTPQVEQEGLALRRDYDNAVKRYKELKDKQMSAELAQELEKGSRAERFSVVEPPFLPIQPIKPNRIGILLLGIALSFVGGIGGAAFAEFQDHGIRGIKGITKVMGEPPLAVIPIFKRESRLDKYRSRKSAA